VDSIPSVRLLFEFINSAYNVYIYVIKENKRINEIVNKFYAAYVQADLVRFRGALPLRATVAAPFLPFLLKTV
jgi:hypothetical protein